MQVQSHKLQSPKLPSSLKLNCISPTDHLTLPRIVSSIFISLKKQRVLTPQLPYIARRILRRTTKGMGEDTALTFLLPSSPSPTDNMVDIDIIERETLNNPE